MEAASDTQPPHPHVTEVANKSRIWVCQSGNNPSLPEDWIHQNTERHITLPSLSNTDVTDIKQGLHRRLLGAYKIKGLSHHQLLHRLPRWLPGGHKIKSLSCQHFILASTTFGSGKVYREKTDKQAAFTGGTHDE